jgi:hypothetical protein
MYKCKYSKVLLWIIIILFSFVLGTWISQKAKESIIAEVKEELIYDEGDIPKGYAPFWLAMGNETVTPLECYTTGMTFGDNVGRISWEKGVMIFEGNAEESAKIFFEGWLKQFVDEYIKSETEKEELIEEPEQIMYLFSTSFDNYRPQWFLKVIDTDMSKCLIDGRLRLELNGEIYWMRLEKDEKIEESDLSEYSINVGEIPGFWFAKPEGKEEPDNIWPVIRLEAYEEGWLRPPCFLETINTDVSEMIVDDRLKLIINGKVYWIRLRADDWKPNLLLW